MAAYQNSSIGFLADIKSPAAPSYGHSAYNGSCQYSFKPAAKRAPVADSVAYMGPMDQFEVREYAGRRVLSVREPRADGIALYVFLKDL